MTSYSYEEMVAMSNVIKSRIPEPARMMDLSPSDRQFLENLIPEIYKGTIYIDPGTLNEYVIKEVRVETQQTIFARANKNYLTITLEQVGPPPLSGRFPPLKTVTGEQFIRMLSKKAPDPPQEDPSYTVLI